MKVTCNFILLLLTISTSWAQKGVISFEHLTTNEGLSQSTVTSIIQDDEGFMWFGTQDGLNKYDGKTLRVYKNDPANPKSLSHNYIVTLFKDRNGDIWIGSDGGGLIFFDRKKSAFSKYLLNPQDSGGIGFNRVDAIEQDEDGNLWVGTYGSGVIFFDTQSKEFTNFKNEPEDPHSLSNDYINDIHIDRKGNVWIATYYGGLNRLDKSSKRFIRFKKDAHDRASISTNDLRRIYEDSRGDIWIGTEGGGLNLYHPDKQNFSRYQHDDHDPESLKNNDVLSINEDAKGNLWIGTRNGGINILKKDRSSFVSVMYDENNDHSLNNNSIYSLCKDAQGNMWVGTYSGGVNFASGLPLKFTHYKSDKTNTNSLTNNNVLSITEDHVGNVWIGTDGGGLNILNRSTNEYRHILKTTGGGINTNYILDVLEDKDHDIWIGHFRGGVDLFNVKENRFTNLSLDSLGGGVETIGQVIQDRRGFVWFGTYGTGMSRYDKKSKTFTHFKPDPGVPGSFNDPVVFAICEDRSGNIWGGSSGSGLYVYDEKSNTFTNFKHDSKDPNSLSSNRVNAIAEDSNGNLWIGTNEGLNLFHPKTKSFTSYQEKDGLPNNVIYGILEDDHENLWLSTNKGLSKFNPKNETFRNYDTSDGLQGNSFNKMSCFKNKNGELYFGGLNGFNVFHPDSIVDNPVIPKVYITNFEIFNKPVRVHQKDSPLKNSIDKTDAITISYKQSVFSFDFAALNYISSDKNQYAYKLEGFDKDWIYSNTNKAIYTNLDPGEYVFKVKASNNDGVWNAKGTAIRIIITPPFWETWAFKILSGLLVIGSIYGFFKIRVRIINNQKILLEQEVRKQTAEVVEQKEALEIEREEAEKARQDAEQANQAKSIFLATMSHEIRTPMNGVLGMASLLAETSQTKEQQEYTDTIRNSGQALLTIINDILDFSKIDSGNLELDIQGFELRQCIEEVMDVFSAKASENGIDLLYQIDHKIPTHIDGDKHRLRQVLINLISNAIKFTHKGEIFVGVDLLNQTSDDLLIGFHVRDTGIGIPEDKLSRLFKAFSQVDTATNRKYGGTGLGLVISQRLVELMGSKISVVSQSEVGTTFSFSIKSRESHKSVLHDLPGNLKDNNGKRVLLVDENATNLEVIKTQLEQWKLDTTLAFSGQEALEILNSSSFDLVIVDMQMPNMDGLQLSKLIKERLPHLPIILMSSIGDESKKKYPDVFAAVLSKPVKRQQLEQDIQAVFKSEGNHVSVSEEKQKYVLSADFAEKYPLSILLAEDNPVNQKLAVRILNKLGYKDIEIASNGLEAVKRLKHQFYEVVLMDMQMPEMDGLEATKAIRLMGGTQPVIIAMTANAMQGDRDLCLQVGMNEYITKPIKLESLMSALGKASESFRVNAGLTQK